MKKVFMGFCIVATFVMALAAVAWFKFCPKPGADEALTFPVDAEYTGWIGKPAELDFVSLDGRRISSSDLRGKVVLIDFWATWCGPCMQSLDHMKETYAKFHEQGLEVVAISFDEDRAALESVVKSKELPWPQFFEGRENSIGKKFGISHYPSAWLVDKVGNVRYVSALTETDKKIGVLLAETEAQAAEVDKNANSGYLGRAKQGLAAIRQLKPANLWNDVMVRARARTANNKSATNTSSVATVEKSAPPAAPAPAPASIAGLTDILKIRGVMLSAKPSVTIQNGKTTHFIYVGDTMRVQMSQGDVTLRCDRIDASGVVLTEVSSNAQVQLRLR